ncbi:hypothetical protein [Thalassospira lohafexi]|uniref:hypothetical protein n=1 Tax=Thalassospira lohafexi TaxID=744227 RepID=UPI0013FE22B7|nr:hypothetical protein [Thalassospira lohafexi]
MTEESKQDGPWQIVKTGEIAHIPGWGTVEVHKMEKVDEQGHDRPQQPAQRH